MKLKVSKSLQFQHKVQLIILSALLFLATATFADSKADSNPPLPKQGDRLEKCHLKAKELGIEKEKLREFIRKCMSNASNNFG